MSCSICLKNNTKNTTRLNCNHEFCLLCIYNWKEKENTCPICRAIILNLDNSPIWIIENMEKSFTKEETPELSREEIEIIQTEFNITVISKIDTLNSCNVWILFVRNNIVILGCIKDDIEYIEDCIAIQRENGKAYPCFPRKRRLEYNSKDRIYNISLN